MVSFSLVTKEAEEGAEAEEAEAEEEAEEVMVTLVMAVPSISTSKPTMPLQRQNDIQYSTVKIKTTCFFVLNHSHNHQSIH